MIFLFPMWDMLIPWRVPNLFFHGWMVLLQRWVEVSKMYPPLKKRTVCTTFAPENGCAGARRNLGLVSKKIWLRGMARWMWDSWWIPGTGDLVAYNNEWIALVLVKGGTVDGSEIPFPTTWDVPKTWDVSWAKLPTLTGEFTGFLNHQSLSTLYKNQKNPLI